MERIRLFGIVALSLIVFLGGCVLVTKQKWDEARTKVESLESENEVLHHRLMQMENQMVSLDERLKALEGPPTPTLDSCREIEGVKDQIRCVARLKDYPEKKALAVVNCESGFDPNIHGDWSRRKKTHLAHGLWQYHYKKHPELANNPWGLSAHDCAHDVICSTDKAIDALKAGNSGWWICYRKLYGGHRRHRRHRRG
jgi:hypothetical protein